MRGIFLMNLCNTTLMKKISRQKNSLKRIEIPDQFAGEFANRFTYEFAKNLQAKFPTESTWIRVMRVRSDTFGDPIFQKGLQN